jgi:hypothetical protein
MKTVASFWPLLLLLQLMLLLGAMIGVGAKLADRSRVVKQRQESGRQARYHDNGRPIEGQAYRSRRRDTEAEVEQGLNRMKADADTTNPNRNSIAASKPAPWKLNQDETQQQQQIPKGDVQMLETPEQFDRKLSSQLSGCCYNYQKYSASSLCSLYGNDCQSGETPSHDDSGGDCEQQGLSFIGISFSVNTASGSPYSYQLCDQFPMENIIDRDYEYLMSMDEDGWLVGGGYKCFDYSGKMP